MTYRCRAEMQLDDTLRDMAESIPSAFAEVDWAEAGSLQCELEDVPHAFPAAFLRSGARAEPVSDVFLCWRPDVPAQWIADMKVCLKVPEPLGTACTIFAEHAGRCDWGYIDPLQVAALTLADQLFRRPS